MACQAHCEPCDLCPSCYQRSMSFSGCFCCRALLFVPVAVQGFGGLLQKGAQFDVVNIAQLAQGCCHTGGGSAMLQNDARQIPVDRVNRELSQSCQPSVCRQLLAEDQDGIAPPRCQRPELSSRCKSAMASSRGGMSGQDSGLAHRGHPAQPLCPVHAALEGDCTATQRATSVMEGRRVIWLRMSFWNSQLSDH